MKKVNIIYWIFTVLLVLSMGFSAVGGFMRNPQGDAMMQHIGITPSIMLFLGVLKILGILALLVPGLPRLKEWAYAGFTFDVLGAMYLFAAAGDPIQAWAPILLWLVFIIGSYVYWHKKLRLQGKEAVAN